jgi:hypothetical protein
LPFSWDALSGQTYFLETATHLNSVDWAALQTNAGAGSRLSFTNASQAAQQRYFRLRVE